jgi:hypothetical protein
MAVSPLCKRHQLSDPRLTNPAPRPSLPSHPTPHILIFTPRVLQTILLPLHIPPLKPTQPINNDSNQTTLMVDGMVSRALPPHRPTQPHALDILDLLRRDLRRIIRDHDLCVGIVGPGGDGLGVVVHLGAEAWDSLCDAKSLVIGLGGTGWKSEEGEVHGCQIRSSSVLSFSRS